MRVLFAGSPEIAVPTLEEIHRLGVLVGVLTNPDRPQGRGKQLKPTPVKERALELNVPVLTFDTLKTEARKAVAKLEPTLLVSFAYARIFGPRFLALFSQGGLNVHPSLLPQYRGASPLTEAILQGVEKTGITIQTLSLQMDEGDILLQSSLDLTGRETTESLTSWAAKEGANLLSRGLREFDILYRTPQAKDGVSYCGKIVKADGEIDWNQPVEIIDRKIRAYTPWPKSFSLLEGVRITILEAEPVAIVQKSESVPGQFLGVTKTSSGIPAIQIATGDGVLAITRLQKAGKKPLYAEDFLRGVQLTDRSVFGV